MPQNFYVGNTVTDVELFSNLNRRDFAVLPGDEDWSLITPTSASSYYRSYPMSSIGGGRYSVTVPVSRTGAYRINARYKVNGGAYVYYTDNGMRRDTAVVVSPKKARETQNRGEAATPDRRVAPRPQPTLAARAARSSCPGRQASRAPRDQDARVTTPNPLSRQPNAEHNRLPTPRSRR